MKTVDIKLVLFFLFSLFSMFIFGQTSPLVPYRGLERPEVPPVSHHFPESQNSGWNSVFSTPGVSDGPVYVMTNDGANLYVAGSFWTAGGEEAFNLAMWDGTKWSSLGKSPDNVFDGGVHSLAYADGKLFAGGTFARVGEKKVNGIAYWDGIQWNGLGPDSIVGLRKIDVFPNGDTLITSGFAYELRAHNNKILVGGHFHLAGSQEASGVAIWDIQTETWETLNGGLHTLIPNDIPYAFSFAIYGNDIYVGGKFGSAGPVAARNLAKWNGTSWSEVGGGANQWVMDLETDNLGNLYVAGFFDSVGTIKASGVARWNGLSWETFADVDFVEPGGTYPSISEIEFVGNQMYVGGGFSHASNMPAWGIARWDGSQWHALDTLLTSTRFNWPGSVSSIEVIANRIYVAGSFIKAGRHYLNHIAWWDQASGSWNKLSDGSGDMGIYDGGISDISVSSNGIYAGGTFTIAGGTYANHIARWSGSVWEPLKWGNFNGLAGSVEALVADGSDLYVAGWFTVPGYPNSYGIARWDGFQWWPLGYGIGGINGAVVYALEKEGDYLYVGGYFKLVGDPVNGVLEVNSMARYNLTNETWEAMGNGVELASGVPGRIFTLESDGTSIYAGGRFALADNQPANNIAVWSNGNWTTIGQPGNNGVNGDVYAIGIIDGEIMVGGSFLPPGTGNTQSLAKWNGQHWTEVHGGVHSSQYYPYIRNIVSSGSQLIISGYFDQAGNSHVSNIALWDGSEWQSLEGGLDWIPAVIEIAGDQLYAGGAFTVAGGKASVSFAQYNLLSTSIAGKGTALPFSYRVYQNYPNPFNPQTTISFDLPKDVTTSLEIFDITGRKIRTLINESKSAGNHRIIWDGRNDQGNSVASGLYVYRIQAGEFVESRKMMLLK